MLESYYKPCRELDICNELIEKYFSTQQYKKCFEGHLTLAEQGYPVLCTACNSSPTRLFTSLICLYYFI